MKHVYLSYFSTSELILYLTRGYEDCIDVCLTNGHVERAEELNDCLLSILNASDDEHDWKAYQNSEYKEWLGYEIDMFHSRTADL